MTRKEASEILADCAKQSRAVGKDCETLDDAMRAVAAWKAEAATAGDFRTVEAIDRLGFEDASSAYLDALRKARRAYNGHETWSAWNVSLWLHNEESLYRVARACARKHTGDVKRAARELQGELPARTPDGARYSLRSLALALRGLT